MAEVELIFKHASRGAYLFEDASGREVWLPKSHAELEEVIEPTVGDAVTVEVADWLAEREGLV